MYSNIETPLPVVVQVFFCVKNMAEVMACTESAISDYSSYVSLSYCATVPARECPGFLVS